MKSVVRWSLGMLAVVLLSGAWAGPAVAAEVPSATADGSDLRTGWYPDEPALAPSQITSERFTRAFETQLQGQVYAQPLVYDGTLLVVTEENHVYGLDPVSGAIRWEDGEEAFGRAIESGPEGSGATLECSDLEPRVGITGTPAIDTQNGIAYFTDDQYTPGGRETTGWFINAVEISSGRPIFHKQIEGVAQNLKGNVGFEALQELQRPALLLMGGVVYAAFGSHCDTQPFEGWIVGVSTSTGQEVTKWATSAHGDSIWQAGGGLVSDGEGRMIFTTGNDDNGEPDDEPGVWDPPPGPGLEAPPEGKLGEAVLRVEPQNDGELAVKDYFSPWNDVALDEADLDLGSAAPVALPAPFETHAHVHLLVQEGKEGTIYLLDRDHLGGREEESSKRNDVVQEYFSGGGVWGSATAWPGEGGYIVIPEETLRFFKFNQGVEEPLEEVGHTSEDAGFGYGSPIVTSDGQESGSGVLWINWCPRLSEEEIGHEGCEHAELRAYDPTGGGSSNPMPFWHESIGYASKFTRPGVSDGHLYVGNREGKLIAFSGPAMSASSESVELAAAVGGQASREVTLTATGSELTIAGASAPNAPFSVAGLPAAGTRLKPGEALRLIVTFAPSATGTSSGAFSVTSAAGVTRVALSGSATPAPAAGASASASTSTSTTATPPPPPAGTPGAAVPQLSSLAVVADASKLRARKRKLAVSFTLTAAGSVRFVVYRRAFSRCGHDDSRTCARWIATRIKLEVAGRAGRNAVTLSLGALASGRYRLSAVPVSRTGAAGSARTLEFKTLH